MTNFTKELQDFAAKMVNTLEDAGDSVRFFLNIIINNDKKQQRKTARKAT